MRPLLPLVHFAFWACFIFAGELLAKLAGALIHPVVHYVLEIAYTTVLFCYLAVLSKLALGSSLRLCLNYEFNFCPSRAEWRNDWGFHLDEHELEVVTPLVRHQIVCL